MDATLAIPRGVTACFSKAGLALGDGAKTGVALVNPTGTGIEFAIDGIAYTKADAATNLPLTVDQVQAADTTCLYLIQVDSAGNVTSVQGESVLTADLTAGKTAVHFPEPADGKCPIGAVKIVTVAVTFTPGTTALDAAGVTETYYDFIGGMPQAPLTS